MRCKDGHEMRVVSETRVRETVEDVVYVTKKIKRFNREGSENMQQSQVPEFVTREVDVDRIEYRCEQCFETQVVRKNEVPVSDPKESQ